jgi:acyl transferase domain-containing protein
MPTTTPADSSEMPDTNLDSGLEAAIAVVGMGVRFPDATTPAAFWTNVRDGFESVRFFTDEEMRARGVPEDLVTHPDFVKAGMVLDGFDTWDAPFFGFNPRDAEIMDPQQRVFMECAWEALEHGGFDPSRFGGSIGVFAGSGMTAYMMYNLVPNTELMDSAGLFLVRHTGNDKDFLATRVSYTFDLKGPSLNIQTACSTSLVAVHVAAQSLLSGECDLALAGGVTIELPHGVGYQYQDGEILSPDGHCRAFDVDSKGTVFGSGAGVVLLRRLSDAMADGDHIHAIIRGSAVNNDGSGKIGYLAPSVDGQAKAVAEAMAVAGVEPDSVTYIETHGTGTPVGDPIEVAALTQAFRAGTDATGFCALASVKSNIGHTDTAAGVAGFIKAVLALEHRQIPPSLHYTAPNPSIDFASSPFYVNAELRDWESSGPRRAGVNSLGVGGTNAHVILEEAPAAPAPEPSREHKLLVLSARTPTALDTATSNLADHLRETDADLADVAYTLQTGRRAFAERRALVCRNAEEAADTLDTPGAAAVVTGTAADQAPSLGFMFAGGGSQYPGMGAGCMSPSLSSGMPWTSAWRTCSRSSTPTCGRCSFPTRHGPGRRARRAGAAVPGAAGAVHHAVRAGAALALVGHRARRHDRPQHGRVHGGMPCRRVQRAGRPEHRRHARPPVRDAAGGWHAQCPPRTGPAAAAPDAGVVHCGGERAGTVRGVRPE